MRISPLTKTAALTALFTFLLLFAFAASPAQCRAAGNVDVTIHCGEGHGEIAERLAKVINAYEVIEECWESASAKRSGTDVIVTCSDSVTAGQMRKTITERLRTIKVGSFLENGEHLFSSEIGLASIEDYRSYDDYLDNVERLKDLPAYTVPGFYLLWTQPFDRDFEISIETPSCGSSGYPSVISETVPLSVIRFAVDSQIKPKWFETKPEGSETYMPNVDFDVYYYKGALEGGKSYYACARFDAPWGTYFPEHLADKITVTANGEPADVMDATGSNEYQNLFVGAYVTPVHSWGGWKTEKTPSALNKGLQRRVCEGNEAHVETRTLPATGVRGSLLARMKAKGKNKLQISWTKVAGAEGYDIFFAECSKKESRTRCRLVKTVRADAAVTWTKGSLKKRTSYKTYVKAFAYKDGRKTYVRTSLQAHGFTSGGSKKYTNPKSVSVNQTKVVLRKNGTFKIKAKVKRLKAGKKLLPKRHGARLRYLSTDPGVAAVSASGRIKAKKPGSCTVYAIAINGVRKGIAVTVR